MSGAVDLLMDLGRWGQTHTTEVLLAMGAAPLALGVVRLLLRGRPDAVITHGSARWATVREVKRMGLFAKEGVVLGRLRGRLLCDASETHVLLVAPTRCHAPGTEILMYDGTIRAVETLRVGEQVMGPDSRPRTILSTHDGVADLVKIHPTKGEAFTVTLDHLLSLQRTNPGKKSWRRSGEICDISVREWRTRSKTFQWQHKLYRTGVEFPPAPPCPLDPWLLGVLLGDGAIGYEAVTIINPDWEIREEVTRLCATLEMDVHDRHPSGGGCPTYGLVRRGTRPNPIIRALRALGLKGCIAGTKFVPQVYKTASREARLAVLAGLLDTDGSYDRGGYDFISKSEQLAQDVVFLARSLGMAAYLTPKVCTWQNGRGLYYRVSISGELSVIPCRVVRKQAAPRQRKQSVLRTAFSVEEVGMGPYYGFTCDGDHRYLTGDFTVTHNSGKGVGVIIPTLFSWPASAIVLDPKDGENYDVTAPWRAEALGNQIAHFTPCRTPHTCINVLDAIRVGTPSEFADALTIAQSLVAPEKMARESATSLHFRELASLILTASLLHLKYTATRASLAGLWVFLTQQHTTLKACLTTLQTTAHHAAGVHQAIAGMTTAIGNITGDRELSSIWSTAIRPLVLYTDPLIARSTDTSTFPLEDLQYGQAPRTLYLVAPSTRTLERLHPLYRVILDTAMARLMDHKVRTWHARLLVCADELPAHGYIRAIDQGAADMAGYGIKGLYVTQDIEQLEDAYGEKNNLWGNTEIKVFHAPTNDQTAQRIAERLMGEGTVQQVTEQHQGGMLGRRSTSHGHTGRAMLTHDEVMELPPHLEIIRMKGIKPILATKVVFHTDHAFRGKAA